jgi:hypothetical protein
LRCLSEIPSREGCPKGGVCVRQELHRRKRRKRSSVLGNLRGLM